MSRTVGFRAVLFASACAGWGGTAFADPPRVPVVRWSEVTRKGAPRAFMSLQDFADCLVKRVPDQSAKFLAIDFPSKEADAEARKLATENASCSHLWFLSFTSEYLRGALIEAAYHQSQQAGAATIRLGSSGRGDRGLSPAVAKCVVQKRSDLSAELLSTRIASPQQRRVFAKLKPDVDQCAREANANRLDPELLRFQIADVLYRHRSSGSTISEVAK